MERQFEEADCNFTSIIPARVKEKVDRESWHVKYRRMENAESKQLHHVCRDGNRNIFEGHIMQEELNWLN